MSEPTSIRIGNSERESATAALDAHLREGRLDADEYGERYARATAARTQDELTALFTDLPQPHPKLPGRRAPKPERTGRHFPGVPVWLVIVAAVGVAGAFGAPWLFGGIFFWVFVIPWMFGGRGGCGNWNRRVFRSHSRSGYEYPKPKADAHS